MALWGNTDLVYSDGTISVNLQTATVNGVVGATTFTSAVSEGDVITVGAGATYGHGVIIGVTSTTLSLASVGGFVTGVTTVPAGTSYFISQEPSFSILDSHYRAPEAKTNFTSGVYGVDENEVSVASTTAYAVTHGGWVGVTTYVDMHGNLRVKNEVLVASGILTTSDASDDAIFPDA
jgi:hypothetical protein